MTPSVRRGLAEILGSRTGLYSLFDRAPTAYILLDSAGLVVGVNRAALRLFSTRRRTDLVGRRIGEMGLLRAKDVAAERRRFADCRDGKKIVAAERKGRTFTGRPIVVESRLCSMTFQGQALVMVSLIDVTERRRATEVLRRQRHRLATAERELRAFSRRLIHVREEERRDLAYLLHHEAGTIAALLRRQVLAAFEHCRAGRRAESQSSLFDALSLLERHVDTLKKYAYDLRPPDLDGLGLVDLLRSLYDAAAERAGLTVSYAFSLERRLIEPPASIVIYRVAQEALNNILAHAGARRVDLALGDRAGAIRLVVRDDGRGFARGARSSPGRRGSMGLDSMTEMARCVGGRVDVRSAPGKGTTIALTIPRVGREEKAVEGVRPVPAPGATGPAGGAIAGTA